MKKVFIEARDNIEIKLPKELINQLKDKKVGLITTIQHLHKLEDVKQQLIYSKAVIGGQILGCNVLSAEKIKDKVDLFLYIGSGKFHPIAVKYKTNLNVITFNPYSKEVSEINKDYINFLERKKKAALVKFIESKNIGIMVSIKPGQDFMKQAIEFKEFINHNYPYKKVYLFIGDNINPYEMENFPFIDVIINTACPRIVEDDFNKPIINLNDLKELLRS